jgi:hypothetical protein
VSHVASSSASTAPTALLLLMLEVVQADLVSPSA